MPKQSFYFSDGPYLQILQGLHAALSSPEAMVRLLGNPQTGKSLLCEKFSQFLRRKDYRVVYFDAAVESPEMLRTLLARELELPSSANFSRLLEDSLQLENDKPIVLIFDDAHLLTDTTLLEIYRLAEIQHATRRMLNIVLCGEPVLEKRLLSNHDLKALLQTVSHRFKLEPMDIETLGQFFYRYAEKAGVAGLQLDSGAMSQFLKTSKGYPGPALSICRLIIESRGSTAEMGPVSKAEFQNLIKSASADHVLPTSGFRESNKLGGLIPIAAVLLIASVGFLYQLINSDTSQLDDNGTLPAQSQQASPFVASEPEPQTEESAASVALVSEVRESNAEPVPAAVEIQPVSDAVVPIAIPQPVSDSTLALVTAQERGVATENIAVPEFETLQEESLATESVEPSIDATATEPASSITVATDEMREPPEQENALEVTSTEPIAPVSAPAAPVLVDTEPAQSSVAAVVEDAALPLSVAATSDSASNINAELPQQLEEAVVDWVAAWQSLSLEDYFASYHSEFSPRYHDDLTHWRNDRRRVIGNASAIDLQLSDFEYVGEDAGSSEVRFWLRYASPTYSDSTQKKLLMQREAGTWRIKEEINLQVRR